MALEGCVVCCTMLWEGESLRHLVQQMGGRYSEVIDSHVTHVVTSRTNTHRYAVAQELYPETPIVHPRWLWACYWSNAYTTVDCYHVDFYTAARRTGTSTALGTRVVFYTELQQYHEVEDRVLPHGIRGHCMRNLLQQARFDEESPHWPFVCRKLQHTAFWGGTVRAVNWRRRRTLLMCLRRPLAASKPRRRMRACRDGPVPALHYVARLPQDLADLVVAFC